MCIITKKHCLKSDYLIIDVLFLLAQSLHHLHPYPARFIGIQSKCKSNNHFKIIVCYPTFRRCQIASLCGYRAKRSTLIYCFDGCSECRGYYPEQLHQFHFLHPNTFAWNIYSTTFADCYNCSFHSYIANEISLND